ncbi:hypothetical protein DRO49_04600, partial [Candidatus Bathyarchaeota archaeon]
MRVSETYEGELAKKINPEAERVTVDHHYSWKNNKFMGTEIYVNGEKVYSSSNYAKLTLTESAIVMGGETLVEEGTLMIQEFEVEIGEEGFESSKFVGATFYRDGLSEVIGKIYFKEEMKIIDMYLQEVNISQEAAESELLKNESLSWAYENVWRDEQGNKVLKGEIVVGITKEGKQIYGFIPSEEGLQEVINTIKDFQQKGIREEFSGRDVQIVVNQEGLITSVLDTKGRKLAQYFYKDNGLLEYELDIEENKLWRYFYGESSFGFPVVVAKAEINNIVGINDTGEVKIGTSELEGKISEVIDKLRRVAGEGGEISGEAKGEIKGVIDTLKQIQESQVGNQKVLIERVIDVLEGIMKDTEFSGEVKEAVEGVVELLKDMREFDLKEERIEGVVSDLITTLEEVNEGGRFDEVKGILEELKENEVQEEKVREAIKDLEVMIGESEETGEEKEEVKMEEIISNLEEVKEAEKAKVMEDAIENLKANQSSQIEQWKEEGLEVITNEEGLVTRVIDSKNNQTYLYFYNKGDSSVSYSVVKIKEGEKFYGKVEVESLEDLIKGKKRIFTEKDITPQVKAFFQLISNMVANSNCPGLTGKVGEDLEKGRLIEELYIQSFLSQGGAGMDIVGGIERFLEDRGVKGVDEELALDISGILKEIPSSEKAEIFWVWTALGVVLQLREAVNEQKDSMEKITVSIGEEDVTIDYSTAQNIVKTCQDILESFDRGDWKAVLFGRDGGSYNYYKLFEVLKEVAVSKQVSARLKEATWLG